METDEIIEVRNPANACRIFDEDSLVMECIYNTGQPRSRECNFSSASEKSMPCGGRSVIFVNKKEYLMWKLTPIEAPWYHPHNNLAKRLKVGDSAVDIEFPEGEGKEIIAIAHHDCGAGNLRCVYGESDLCGERSCDMLSSSNQPMIMYVFKLDYMTLKLTSL